MKAVTACLIGALIVVTDLTLGAAKSQQVRTSNEQLLDHITASMEASAALECMHLAAIRDKVWGSPPGRSSSSDSDRLFLYALKRSTLLVPPSFGGGAVGIVPYNDPSIVHEHFWLGKHYMAAFVRLDDFVLPDDEGRRRQAADLEYTKRNCHLIGKS